MRRNVLRARFTVTPDTATSSRSPQRFCWMRVSLKSSTIPCVISSSHLPRKNFFSALQLPECSSRVLGLCCCSDHFKNCSTDSSNLGACFSFVNPARRSSRSILRFASARSAAVLFRKPEDSWIFRPSNSNTYHQVLPRRYTAIVRLPPIRRVFVGVDYTLRKPTVKVARPVTHTVAADFYVRNAPFLASPLRQSLNRKARDLRDFFSCEKLRRRG